MNALIKKNGIGYLIKGTGPVVVRGSFLSAGSQIGEWLLLTIHFTIVLYVYVNLCVYVYKDITAQKIQKTKSLL